MCEKQELQPVICIHCSQAGHAANVCPERLEDDGKVVPLHPSVA